MKKVKDKKSNIPADNKRYRLSVFRSHRHIYAQIIDDDQGKTLVAAGDKNLSKAEKKDTKKKGKKILAYQVGLLIGQKAIGKKIKKVYFDRRSYRYHGRVRALAEGARKSGLDF